MAKWSIILNVNMSSIRLMAGIHLMVNISVNCQRPSHSLNGQNQV
jgi:hypothetical protein